MTAPFPQVFIMSFFPSTAPYMHKEIFLKREMIKQADPNGGRGKHAKGLIHIAAFRYLRWIGLVQVDSFCVPKLFFTLKLFPFVYTFNSHILLQKFPSSYIFEPYRWRSSGNYPQTPSI